MTGRPGSIPLSGEILADEARAPAPAPARVGDFVDADYETVGQSRSQESPRSNQAATTGASSANPDNAEARAGMDMLKKHGNRGSAERGGVLFYTAGLAVVMMAFWISGGHALFGTMTPLQTGSTHAETMRLGGITTEKVVIGDSHYLLVSGHVRNEGDGVANVPPIRIAVTGKSGEVQNYRMGSRSTAIGAGERLPFSSRLDAPVSGVESVLVTLIASEKN